MFPRIVDNLNAFFGTDLFRLFFPGYIHMLVLGALLGGWIGLRNVRSAGLSPSLASLAAFLGYGAAFAGARALDVLVHFETYRQDPLSAFVFWRGDLVAYGGLLAGISVFALTIRSRDRRLLSYLDCGAPALGVGIALTRVGCFLNGCCYGTPTDLPWGVRFPRPSGAFTTHLLARDIRVTDTLSLPVHPVQLYASAAGLFLFAAGSYWLRRRHRPGEVFWRCCALYAVMRFGMEFFRADTGRGGLGLFSTSQWISAAFLAVALPVLFQTASRRRAP